MKTKRIVGLILMLVGAALVLYAVLAVATDRFHESQASKSADRALSQIAEYFAAGSVNPDIADTDSDAQDSKTVETVIIDDFNYFATIEIPSIKVSLPLIDDWSYPALNAAPCRYTGSIETGDLIIAGHNYTAHFGGLSSLEKGDPVIIRLFDDTVYNYTVNEIKEYSGNDVNGMISDGGWDLTLFTCTASGTDRVAVRCVLQEENSFSD